MTIGFALCGSFCTYAQVFPVMEQLAKEYRLVPIFSAAGSEKALILCNRRNISASVRP